MNYSIMDSRNPLNVNVMDQSLIDSGMTLPNSTNQLPVQQPSGQNSNWFQSWGGPALQGAGALWSGYNGWQQTKVAREGLKESKRQFNMNWEAQKALTNRELFEQQRRKIAAQGGQMAGDLSPEEYQMKWGIK
ncbi:hypothetical protein [Bacterioplanoides pacificum]|uniref:Uncharacterized protein n=1 Tax=Bacterioplanoides pacificum TaxID=1171596 RepID=A0ABV7VSU8_9GAMM